MKNKVLATLGTAAVTVGLYGSAAYAGYYIPGETMGVALLSPLPPGIFFGDLETYGRADKQPDINTGVNIPLLVWSTPWTFADSRVEFLVATPFAHTDVKNTLRTVAGLGPFGPGVAAAANPTVDADLSQFGAGTYAFGPALAHSFGNGLTGGLAVLARTPSLSPEIRELDGRTVWEGDFRETLQYIVTSGPMSGVTIIQNAGVTSALGQNYYGKQTGEISAASLIPSVGAVLPPIPGLAGAVATGIANALAPYAQNDMFAGDFTIEKNFGKFTLGVTGFGNIDLDNRGGGRQSSVEIGGLLGYDFGRFRLTGIVTHTVYVNQTGISDTLAGIVSEASYGNAGYETRGWLSVVLPLYITPEAAPVVAARY